MRSLFAALAAILLVAAINLPDVWGGLCAGLSVLFVLLAARLMMYDAIATVFRRVEEMLKNR